MSIDIRPVPFDGEVNEDAPPEVREVQRKITALIKATREQHGERFANLTQLLYAIAQLRLYMHAAPASYSTVGNHLISQVAVGVDKLLEVSGDDVERAGAIAQQLVDLCLIKRDDIPDRRH